MQKKTDQHVFQGMQRDMSISKQKAEFLWDANNIRLTSRHGDTLFSMTNERGTKEIQLDNSITGVVLGYCVLGDYLTVFTTSGSNNSKPDYIYRIKKGETGFSNTVLYNGNLSFDVEHPIETLGIYENEKIQKVYWTDGINQPRLINITKEDVTPASYIDTSFDFVPTLELNDTIHVTKMADSSGIFAAGVVQYAVTYYNKYGQESNVSVVSPLIPTSYSQRAGGPEDTIGNAFKVIVEHPDVHFEYMRLYSIFRSSKDTTPVCKRVADVKLGYGGVTSNNLTTSNDVHPISYAQITGHPMLKQKGRMYTEIKLTPTSGYIRLSTSGISKESAAVTINGHVFNAGHYWHFTKAEYPNMIVRDYIYNEDTETPDTDMTYFTWGEGCADIYISDGKSADGINQQSAVIAGAPSPMRAAEIMYYNTLVYGDSVVVVDNGTIGDDVDYNELLFVGGEEITAATLTQKDGTMFLGGIDIKRPRIKGAYNIDSDGDHDNSQKDTITINNDGSNLVNAIRNRTHINTTSRACVYPLTMGGGVDDSTVDNTYEWGNSLNAMEAKIQNDAFVSTGYSTNTAGFKYGEHYRLGLQFQYKTGKWSQPVFIEDAIYTNATKPHIANNGDMYTQVIPAFKATLGSSVGQYMLDNGYKRVRSVVCLPTLSDQLIICQGILNPTVYSIGHRHTHSPDIQSSWFFRPVVEGAVNNTEQQDSTQEEDGVGNATGSGSTSGTEGNNNTYQQDIDPDGTGGGTGGSQPSYNNNPNANAGLSAYNGAFLQYKHDYMLYTSMSRGAEIQPAPRKVGDKILYNDIPSSEITVGVPQKYNSLFAVDSRYLTMHSPEFEFNDSFYAMDFNDDVSCFDIAKAKIANNLGDIHILTSTPTIDPDSIGFFHTTIHSTGSARRIVAGLFYMDLTVKREEKDNVWKYKGDSGQDMLKSFLVYPWHRTGSVNNDIARPDNEGTRSAMLSQKKMSNLMFCRTCVPNNTESILASGDDIRIFNSDQISLLKINGMNYFGNVEQVLNPEGKYPIVGSKEASFDGGLSYRLPSELPSDSTDISELLKGSSEPAIMKYKSTPHAIVHTSTPIDNTQEDYPYLHFVELRRAATPSTDFGGLSQDGIHSNLWYPAGPAVKIGYDVQGNKLEGSDTGKTIIPFWYGDTYYQRYDCLKTYPFTDEDTNSIIEIGSFMVETRINLDGRYDKNRGIVNNFMLNPTVFNLINPVYSQKDNFFNYRILDDDYYALSNYPTMVTWTGYKNNAAEVDSWTNITLASTLEMDGTKGKVNAVRVNSDQLYCFQDDAIGQILFNSRVQISPSDGVPIEISNNYKVDGNRYISTSIGCKNKWSIAEGTDGLYFIDGNTEALYQLGGQAQIKPISTPLNMSYWFAEQDCSTTWLQYYRSGDYKPDQQGARCFYDSANADLYICTPEKTLCFSEKLGQFVSFFDYHHPIGMFNIDSEYYALNYPDDETSTDVKLWGMFQGQYNTFFDKTYQTDFTFISNADALNDKIFSNIELRGDFRYWPDNMPQEDFNSPEHQVDHNRMFDTIRVWNEYQDTGDIDLTFKQDVPSNMKKKFRIWRMDIPRDKDNIRQRIRNTWSKVKFTMNTTSDILYDMEIHDIDVVYYL